MSKHTYFHRSHFDVPAADLFAWHEAPGAFEKLCPPWSGVKLLHSDGITDGSKVILQLPVPGLKWTLEHSNYVRGKQFQDRQLSGPFAFWRHTHTFIPDAGDRGCTIEDKVEYEFLISIFDLPARIILERELDRMFKYRLGVLRKLLSVPA